MKNSLLKREDFILAYESNFWIQFQALLASCEKIFECEGLELTLEQYWMNKKDPSRKIYYDRIPFSEGYCYYVGYVVKVNGKSIVFWEEQEAGYFVEVTKIYKKSILPRILLERIRGERNLSVKFTELNVELRREVLDSVWDDLQAIKMIGFSTEDTQDSCIFLKSHKDDTWFDVLEMDC